MPSTRTLRMSFAGGELSPRMHGRVDDAKYQAGAATLRNFTVEPQGVAENRAGLKYVATTKNTDNVTGASFDKVSRLIPFKFGIDQQLQLEFGDFYIRFHATVGGVTGPVLVDPAGPLTFTFQDDDPVTFGAGTDDVTWAGHVLKALEPVVFVPAGAAVTFTNNAGNILVNWAAHPFANLDRVKFTGTLPAGITAGTYYFVRNQAAGTFELSATGAGPIIAWPGGGPYSGDGRGALPSTSATTGLAEGQVYYVRAPVAGAFNISETPTGALLTFTDVGSGGITGRRRYSLADLVTSGGEYFYCTLTNDSTAPPNVAFWYELADDIYEVPTFYPAADVFGIRYDQSFDVLTLTHTGHFPRELRRFGATQWTWVPVLLAANLPAPANPSVVDWNGVKVTLQGVTNGAPRVFTTSVIGVIHQFVVGDLVFLADITTDPNITDQFYIVDTVPGMPTPTTFTLKTYSGNARVDGGTAVPAGEGTVALAQPTVEIRNRYRVTAIDAKQNESDPSTIVTANNNLFVIGAFNAISWDSVPGAVRYAVFKERDGLYGFIGQTEQDARPLTATVTFNAGPETVTWTGHQLVTGEAVRFDEDTIGHGIPALSTVPIVVGQTYFVRVIDANTFYLTATPNPEAPILVFGTSPLARATRRYKFTDDAIAPDLGTTPPIRDTTDLNAPNNYPGAVSHFEQRRMFAGTLTDPQTTWGTRSNTESDLAYSLPSRDDDRLKFKLATREQQIIRHIVPLGELLLLTDTAEWRVSAVNSEALTPDSISARPQSYIGAGNARPVVTNYAMLFAAARGGHLREMTFNFNVNGYVTGDLSLRAAHLFDGLTIVDLAHGKSPHPLVYAGSSNGKLLVMTYVPEEQVVAWTQWDTDGAFESVSVISEGTEDVCWAIVRRTIGGVTKRFVERQASREFATIADATFLDAFKTYSGTPTNVVSGLSHLNGKTVHILADGKVHPSRVVAAGSVTLDYDASKIHVGLGYVSDLLTLPVTLQVAAFGIGRTKNVSGVQLRVVDTAGVMVGPDENQLVSLDPYFPTATLRSGPVDSEPLPAWTEDGQVLVRQSDPLPVTIVGMSFEVAVGG